MSELTPVTKLPRGEKENGDPASLERRHIDVDTPGNDFDYDIVQHLGKLQLRGKYCGAIRGRKICIDNLGWTFDPTVLQQELRQHLTGVQSVQFATTELESARWHGGYGCIEFDSVANAVKGLIELDDLYLDCPGSPIPRPILSHFPAWETAARGEDDFPGYILNHGVSPHFCQQNTREYDIALEWKFMERCQSMAKKRLCDVFYRRIWKELSTYIKESDDTAIHSAFTDQPLKERWSTVVCKGVSIELTNEQIRDAVEVADHCSNVHRLRCPISNCPLGTVFVQISSPQRAVSFVDDMNHNLYILGRSPRPSNVSMLRIGPPAGFDGVFDRAIETAFHVKLTHLLQSHQKASHIVNIQSWPARKKRCCFDVRKILDEMVQTRIAWKMETLVTQRDWHARQKEYIDNQMAVLEKLEHVASHFLNEDNI